MRKQHGQSLVEFALIIPMFTLFLFGLIYGGIMFRDFLDFSNEARTVARQIAVASDNSTPSREQLITSCTKKYEYGIYDVDLVPSLTPTASEPDDVLVTVTFTMKNETGIPSVLANNFDFPPKEFTLKYRMKLE